MQKISVSVELFKGWKRKLHVHVPHQKTPEEHVCNCQKSTFQQNLLDGGGGVRLTRPNREALAASITNFLWDLFRRRVGIARQAESVLSVLQDGRVNRLLLERRLSEAPLASAREFAHTPCFEAEVQKEVEGQVCTTQGLSTGQSN